MNENLNENVNETNGEIVSQTIEEIVNKSEVSTSETQKKEGLGTASMIIGIISLVLSFILGIISFPLSFVGLILGIVNKAKKGKKISGIVLNAVSLLTGAISFIIAIIIIFSIPALLENADGSNFFDIFLTSLNRTSGNIVYGNWKCKKYSSYTGTATGDYILELDLNKNNTFIWKSLTSSLNLDIDGTFVATDITSTKSDTSGASYYKIELTRGNINSGSSTANYSNTSNYEMAINYNNGKKRAIMINEKSYNMYVCDQN